MEPYVLVAALCLITGLCATGVVYPYLIYPLILRALPSRPVRVGDGRSDCGREFALLFCAYNEHKALPSKIQNLRNLQREYPQLEILAYDDCSSDDTATMLENSGLNIRVIRGCVRAGKAHGMKILASQTNREFLVFTDANVDLDVGALHQLSRAYADPTVGGVCGVLEYTGVDGSSVAHAGGLYWRLEEALKTLESKSGNVMGGDGSIFSVRRQLYPEFPDTVLDDMTVSMTVIFEGFRLIKDPLVIAREQLVTSRQDDYHRRVRIAMRCFHTHLWFRPRLRAMRIGDRWRWWSHRYLRWLGGFLLAIGYVSGLAALAVAGQPLIALAVIGLTALIAIVGTYVRTGPLSTLVHLISSILVTGIGVFKARRGQIMATWKPPTR